MTAATESVGIHQLLYVTNAAKGHAFAVCRGCQWVSFNHATGEHWTDPKDAYADYERHAAGEQK